MMDGIEGMACGWMDGWEVGGYEVKDEGRPGWDGGLLLVSLGREVYIGWEM